MPATAVGPARFRQIMGNHPTGVAVVTAVGSDGAPAGLAVGTFLSVSLNPMLVGFLPARASSTFPRIRTADSFCVNVLAAEQNALCRRFAARGGDKFAGLAWEPTSSGAPRLPGSAAWFDCRFHTVSDVGDHHFVVGSVHDMGGADDPSPLLFFRGGLGRFTPLDAARMER